jgi:hypothetical protein
VLKLTQVLAVCLGLAVAALAQQARVIPAPPNYMPGGVDSNSPAFWVDGEFRLFNSTGFPLLSVGSSQFQVESTEWIESAYLDHAPIWIEATWTDPDGIVFAWYHHEPGGLCPGNNLTAPEIGALVSFDGGRTFSDLGIVLKAAEPIDCSAKNGFFGGGHGDFSVIPDRAGENLYFLFSTYGGELTGQGIAIARMSAAGRFGPVGAVWKFHDGAWEQPGLGGLVTPIFSAKKSWMESDTDSFWGPSVHFNTGLNSYVILMNHACCEPRWKQEGIYVSYNGDVSDPGGWSAPVKLLDESQIGYSPGWYPQVLGLGPDETDTLAGSKARLYIHGVSLWEIEFGR